MTKENLPSFTPINSYLCLYCNNIAIYSENETDNYACGVNFTPKGRFRRQSSFPRKNCLDFYHGCEKFESSGLPAHPLIIEDLVRANPLAASIPIDGDATETSWDFSSKMLLFQHIDCNSSLMPKKF